ncbi:helix-turn-helix transcriptional regulator [Verrucomicrobiaceae bacterium 5K15]|uniref:Helix-turn-helix transcriptional regulator n=1 Tax=Oceaniferula flava TaxID=2800421 RepID=A0AAE2SD44_9BACT|nr:helix-turn-helix transcriptional regulator [Oceaniferula flavus]MBK1856021.1 helix-turn-helix transcriptional regulator [Oceaniferula flavus]MBM1137328.1 helix-turn-helix transcriptional regulator [Oceaniferula flavus]
MTTNNDNNLLTDDAVMALLGERAKQLRLRKNLTQTQLAKQSGVAKRTIERFENGASVQLTSFMRVLRALGQLTPLMELIPEYEATPMEMLMREKKGSYNPKKRLRASSKKTAPNENKETPWQWGAPPTDH